MNKLLVVVDMQNDFIDGSLGTEEALAILPQVKKKMEKALADGQEIVFTLDTHQEDYLSTSEGKKLPVPHCIKGTNGWELAETLKTYEGKRFEKPTFGCEELAKYIKEKGYGEIELIGLCTDICVISNALLIKAAVPESEVTVDSACCAGVTKKSHENALEAMRMCQIIIK